ncbi:transglutaminase-like cysteine peptidase [Chitinibacteraceae bacterium HSL-7]
MLRTLVHALALFCGLLVLYPLASALDERFTLSSTTIANAEKRWPGAGKRLNAWMELLDGPLNQAAERDKLTEVNRFFNQITFVSDPKHWNRTDYWATPVEMLGSAGGDCEDFAIGKYFSLIRLGVPVDKLRITYVKALNWNPIDQAHMVLAYYPEPTAEPLILDNLIPDIKPASQRTDLIPVYSFNGQGLWLAKERGSGRVGSSDRIGLWRDLTARMGKL